MKFHLVESIDTANHGLEALEMVKNDFYKNNSYSSYKLILMDC